MFWVEVDNITMIQIKLAESTEGGVWIGEGYKEYDGFDGFLTI